MKCLLIQSLSKNRLLKSISISTTKYQGKYSKCTTGVLIQFSTRQHMKTLDNKMGKGYSVITAEKFAVRLSAGISKRRVSAPNFTRRFFCARVNPMAVRMQELSSSPVCLLGRSDTASAPPFLLSAPKAGLPIQPKGDSYHVA